MDAPPELRISAGRSEYHDGRGNVTVFLEGVSSSQARKRSSRIDAALGDGFLLREIEECRAGSVSALTLSATDRRSVLALADGVTSERGRGIVALTVLQLAIKVVCPGQDIRLHKAARSAGTFGWVEGVSMRTLDKAHVTPVLRKTGLLRMNADGAMMTRGLAENYPYTLVYRAALRGPRDEWLTLIDRVEAGIVDPAAALRTLVGALIARTDEFDELAEDVVAAATGFAPSADDPIGTARALIWHHVVAAEHSARLMEVALHSLLLALEEDPAVRIGTVRPLGQMRSANKKHGNVGDVELEDDGVLVVAWDAKYGKCDLLDALEELGEKLEQHPDVIEAGFVISDELDNDPAHGARTRSLSDEMGATVRIVQFDEWVDDQTANASDAMSVARRWVALYSSSLALRNRERAPLDEPTWAWLETLLPLLES